jgi:hypothetical protein
MYARAVDEAEERLDQLRREEWTDFGFGALALGLAVAASAIRPALALPLLAGGLAAGVLGTRALWRRWDLLDRLAGERDAYVVAEVLARASRDAATDRRRDAAASIRRLLRRPDLVTAARVRELAEELEALASELGDGGLALDPACAVDCMRLLDDPVESPLLNPALPPAGLHARISRIRSGFTPAA